MLREWLKQWYQQRSIFDPTKNYSSLPFKLVKKFRGKTVVDVGAGEAFWGEGVITIDKYALAQIKGDAMDLPIKNRSVDLVLSIAVLEHLPEPYQAVQELHRVLKKGGEVYIEIPFLQPLHGSPDDYFRATLPGLKHWCRAFQEISSGVCVGPGSAVSWIEIEYVRLWFGKVPLLGLLAELVIRLWSLPLKYLDKLIIEKKEAKVTASAIYFHGRKP